MFLYTNLNKLFSILKFLMVILTLFFMMSCSDDLPSELDLDDVIFEEKISHFMGPGGLNRSFRVYKLSNDVIDKLQSQKLLYLNNLQSSQEKLKDIQNLDKETLFDVPFADWHETPIIKETKWLKRGRAYNNNTDILIENFFQDDGFTAKIPADIRELFHKVAHSPNSFYSYGGYRDMCVLVVSPEFKRAFYLFRD